MNIITTTPLFTNKEKIQFALFSGDCAHITNNHTDLFVYDFTRTVGFGLSKKSRVYFSFTITKTKNGQYNANGYKSVDKEILMEYDFTFNSLETILMFLKGFKNGDID
jgi:hypothetical protein